MVLFKDDGFGSSSSPLVKTVGGLAGYQLGVDIKGQVKKEQLTLDVDVRR